MSVTGSHIVLGVDETDGSDIALRWALDEARSRNVLLRLVAAYPWMVGYGAVPFYGVLPETDGRFQREVAEQALAEMARRARDIDASVEIDRRAIDGRPAAVLAQESKQAALVVVGSRRLHALGASILGSVGTNLAAHVSCPVVVVRGPDGPAGENPVVVVGVDGMDGSDGVLAFGFDYATRHQAPLEAVLCWHPSLPAMLRWNEDPADRNRAEVWLSESLAGWREQYPDVIVESKVILGHAVENLVAESTDQRLLVVGSRGRHALSSTLLGSVSQGVLHHAQCPVAVVPLAVED